MLVLILNGFFQFFREKAAARERAERERAELEKQREKERVMKDQLEKDKERVCCIFISLFSFD